MSSVDHLTTQQQVRFVAGEMAEAEARRLEDHIDLCPACREALSQLVRMRAQDQASLAATHPGSGQALPVAAGDIIEGRFRIEKLLGTGGMGCVFEAHQLHLNQRVALKFLLPQYAKDASVVDRFTREARAAVRLVTEHVGRLLDFGTLPKGEPYLVMELLVGESVERRLTREGPFEPSQALRIVRDVTLALEEAHALGIVHRDLKPANLFLARRSNGTELVKVLDFGIAKSVHPDIEAGLNNTGGRMMLGTPLYMAPEQLSHESVVDARTDIWALGCVLHQLVTGEPPFKAADLVSLMYAIQRLPHPRFERHPGLAAVIDRCLAKEPAARFDSVVALRQQLDALLSPGTERTLAQPPEVEFELAPPSRRGVRAALILAAVVALLGLGGWVLWSPGSEPSAEAPVPEPLLAKPSQAVVVPAAPPTEAPSASAIPAASISDAAPGKVAPADAGGKRFKGPAARPAVDPLGERL